MAYKNPSERMEISLRRSEVEATGKPFFASYHEVPEGMYSKSQCKKMKKPVIEGEEPSAYVLNKMWNGYLPLYERVEE